MEFYLELKMSLCFSAGGRLDWPLCADQNGYRETIWTSGVEKLSSAGKFEGSDIVCDCELSGGDVFAEQRPLMTVFLKLWAQVMS